MRLPRLDELTFRDTLRVLFFVYVGGLLTVFLITWLPLQAMQIGGAAYGRIVEGRDLSRDVMPPPMYALESALTFQRLAQEYDEAKRQALLAEVVAQRKGFEAHAADWLGRLPEGEERRLVEAAVSPAREFYDAVVKELVPAMDAGDAMKALAAQDRAKAAFARHREANRALSEALEARVGREEAAATARSRAVALGAAGLTLILVAVSAWVSLRVARRIAAGLRGVAAETSRVTRAVAEEGRLDVRGDREQVVREFRPVIDELNGTLDALTRPVTLARAALDRLSRGDLPPAIEETFRGDLDEIRIALNRSVAAVAALLADAHGLAAAAVEGTLSARADASEHHGEFRRIVEGMNDTLEAVAAPAQEASQVLARLAAHDLGARMEGLYCGDHAALKDAVNGTAAALGTAIRPVADAVRHLAEASEQLTATSQKLSRGAEAQSVAVDRATASAGALAETATRGGEEATRADGLVREAQARASEGERSMAALQGSMAEIRKAAEGTSQIIRDINEIAFQTNLLALNAAVEAARAGDAGRSFAVVAEEVRSLALRSKAAASRTEQLIRASVDRAAEGAATAHTVSEQLAGIAAGVAQVSEIVGRIAKDNRDQSGRFRELSGALDEVGGVTAANAAASEESIAMADRLSGESRELEQLVGDFKLADADPEAGAAASLDQGARAGDPRPLASA